jgi:hypothetical protein
MKAGYLLASITALALLHSTANALDECMATLKDQHGSVVSISKPKPYIKQHQNTPRRRRHPYPWRTPNKKSAIAFSSPLLAAVRISK